MPPFPLHHIPIPLIRTIVHGSFAFGEKNSKINIHKNTHTHTSTRWHRSALIQDDDARFVSAPHFVIICCNFSTTKHGQQSIQNVSSGPTAWMESIPMPWHKRHIAQSKKPHTRSIYPGVTTINKTQKNHHTSTISKWNKAKQNDKKELLFDKLI